MENVCNGMPTLQIKEVDDNDHHPLFSFKYLNDVTIKKVKDGKFFVQFLNRLKQLSLLGWAEIELSHRHSFGIERMPKGQLRHLDNLPSAFEKYREFDVFRATGNNRVFVGKRLGDIFYILLIEYVFGDVSSHGGKKR